MKASRFQVKQAISHYVHSAFLDRDYVNAQDLPSIAKALSPFSNVKMKILRSENGETSPDCVITVSGFPSGVLMYEIRSNGKKLYHDPLAWIDEIEEWEALFY